MRLGWIRRALTIGQVVREREGDRDRVTARVAGVPVWFESRDAPLAARPEAFAGAFLLVALAERRSLRCADPVDAAWRANAERMVPILRRWWGYDGPDPLAGLRGVEDATPPRPLVGACFTGGVDSFFALLHLEPRSDMLVYAHGYDVRLDDTARMNAYDRSFREVAAATGRRAVVVTTNLRAHPALAALDWERAHGGGLVALGHLLTDTIGTLLIPPSWGIGFEGCWGSHWDTDPLASSARLHVVHGDATLKRWDRLERMLDEPLVRRHLRVCWENRAPALNCARCEKCLRTRVILARFGVGEAFREVFSPEPPLPHAIDRLNSLSPEYVSGVWVPMLAWTLPPDVRAAVERLVSRSG